jgi:hypothetical protein
VAALDVYYRRDHGAAPTTVSTSDEVTELIDRVRAESPESAPILMELHLSGDPYTQGLDVGINGDCGVLRYSGRDWPEGVYSAGSAGRKPVAYFYMDTWTEFPANAEVPLTIVRQAVQQFLATDGARPTCVEWQAG